MRGQSMILPPSVVNQYSQDDPNNPYLRRHHATLECITQALENFHPNHNEEITISKVPIVMCNIVDKVNIHVLNLPTDIKLVKRQVWRLHYRSLYGNKFKVIPNATSLSHHAIYIQKRHSTTSELVLGRQKRKPSETHQMIDQDYYNIASMTTIVQTSSNCLFYGAPDLHANHHGSVSVNDLLHKNIILDIVGVPHQEISIDSANRYGIAKDRDIVVAFETSALIKKLDSKLCLGGLTRFHKDLVTHLLQGGAKDQVRMQGKIDDTKAAYNIRCRFGFGRIQPDIRYSNWTLWDQKMPGINVSAFFKMPKSLQSQLITVMELGNDFLKKHYSNVFNDELRNAHCSTRLNKELGYPQSRSRFEYIEVSLSRNTVLKKHIDHKNDHRVGYNHCAVYSFFETIHDIEFRVAIIMTSRCTVGCAFQKALLSRP